MNTAIANESLSTDADDLAQAAAIALDQMHFGAARLLAEAALDMEGRAADGLTTANLLPVCIIAQALYEEGRLADAEALLVPRLPDIRADGTLEAALRAHLLLARIAASRRQCGRGLLILGEAEALARRHSGWQRLQAASLAHQVELYVASERLDDAARCLHQLAELAAQLHDEGGSRRFEIQRFHTMAHARVALNRAPFSVDIAALWMVHRATVQRRDPYTAASIALLLVEALQVSGQADEALEVLSELLRLAPTVGLHQTLIDCSAGVAAMIEAIVQGRITPPGDMSELLSYTSVLLSRRQGAPVDAHEPGVARRSSLNAGLSERERLIVGLMGQGLSNKQIALELCIAPETVKSHAKRLYAKLSVRNRTEAVTLASRLGLFPVPRSVSA